MNLQDVRQRLPELGANDYAPALDSGLRIAAVLILIHQSDDGPALVLTRRSNQLVNHAGQISFPGGSIEPDDVSLADTALREAREEIGLSPNDVEVLGELDPVTLPSGFWVSPVLAMATSLPLLKADPSEVEEIFTLPLDFLMQKGLFQHGSRIRNGIKREFYYFDFKEYYIWGATAAMLRNLSLTLGAPRADALPE